jgi:hypothetical protein
VLDQAFVTLATSDSYAIGALVLGHSLKSVGTSRQLVVMITTDISANIRYVHVDIDILPPRGVKCGGSSSGVAHLARFTRPLSAIALDQHITSLDKVSAHEVSVPESSHAA